MTLKTGWLTFRPRRPGCGIPSWMGRTGMARVNRQGLPNPVDPFVCSLRHNRCGRKPTTLEGKCEPNSADHDPILPEFESLKRMSSDWSPTILLCLPCLWLLAVLGRVSPSSGQDLYQNYAEPDRSQICPNCNHRLPRVNICGWKGHPWRDKVPGGCRCGKPGPWTWYNLDCHWPAPFSVLADHGHHGDRRRSTTSTTKPRLRDALDCFADLRLLPPVRCDNGYTGRYCDPYGYLGRSRRGQTVVAEPAPFPEELPAPSREPLTNKFKSAGPIAHGSDRQQQIEVAASRLWAVPASDPRTAERGQTWQSQAEKKTPPEPVRVADVPSAVWTSNLVERNIEQTVRR